MKKTVLVTAILGTTILSSAAEARTRYYNIRTEQPTVEINLGALSHLRHEIVPIARAAPIAKQVLKPAPGTERRVKPRGMPTPPPPPQIAAKQPEIRQPIVAPKPPSPPAMEVVKVPPPPPPAMEIVKAPPPPPKEIPKIEPPKPAPAPEIVKPVAPPPPPEPEKIELTMPKPAPLPEPEKIELTMPKPAPTPAPEEIKLAPAPAPVPQPPAPKLQLPEPATTADNEDRIIVPDLPPVQMPETAPAPESIEIAMPKPPAQPKPDVSSLPKLDFGAPPAPPTAPNAPNADASDLPSVTSLFGNDDSTPPPPPAPKTANTPPAASDAPPAVKIAEAPSPAPNVGKPAIETVMIPEQTMPRMSDLKISSEEPALSVPFSEADDEFPISRQARLTEIAELMQSDIDLIVTVKAYASGSPEQASLAKRTSLARALSVRKFLREREIPAERMRIKAMGNEATSGVPDRVDIFLSKEGRG